MDASLPVEGLAALMYCDCSGSMQSRVPAFNVVFEEMSGNLMNMPDKRGPDRSKLCLFNDRLKEEFPLLPWGPTDDAIKAAGVDKILTEWLPRFPQKISGQSRIWEAIYDDVIKEHRALGKGWRLMVYVLTDGQDNNSSGSFFGLKGSLHMVEELAKLEIVVMLNLIPFGNDISKADIGALTQAAKSTGGNAHVVPDDVNADTKRNFVREFVKPIQAIVDKVLDEPNGGHFPTDIIKPSQLVDISQHHNEKSLVALADTAGAWGNLDSFTREILQEKAGVGNKEEYLESYTAIMNLANEQAKDEWRKLPKVALALLKENGVTEAAYVSKTLDVMGCEDEDQPPSTAGGNDIMGGAVVWEDLEPKSMLHFMRAKGIGRASFVQEYDGKLKAAKAKAEDQWSKLGKTAIDLLKKGGTTQASYIHEYLLNEVGIYERKPGFRSMSRAPAAAFGAARAPAFGGLGGGEEAEEEEDMGFDLFD